LIERTVVAPQDTQLYVTSSKPLVNSTSLGFEGIMAVLHSGHFMVGKLLGIAPILADLLAMCFFAMTTKSTTPVFGGLT
jgi:hypothetical protein